jgi:hypothetical protein
MNPLSLLVINDVLILLMIYKAIPNAHEDEPSMNMSFNI